MKYLLSGALCFVVWLACNIYSRRQERGLPSHVKADQELHYLWLCSRSYWLVIGGPAGEELLFRLPLLLCFSTFSPLAITCVFVSALIFAVIHNNPAELGRVKWIFANWKKILGRTYLQFLLGIATGVTAIWADSLLAAVAVHMLWNLNWWLYLQRYFARSNLSFREKLLFSEWHSWKLRLQLWQLGRK